MRTIWTAFLISSFCMAPCALAKRGERPYARETRRVMERINAALARYHQFCQAYPTTQAGLQALHQETHCQGKSKPAFMPKMGQDAWHRDFKYISDGKTYKLISLGRDGREGGEGEDTDLIESR